MKTESPPLPTEVHDRLAEEDADRAAARRFFWKWLICATLLTLAGNAGHVFIPSAAPQWVRLAVALVPPFIALLAIHGVTVLARVGSGTRAGKSADRTFRVAVAATVILAIDAAVISFAGLYGIAIASGMSTVLAVLFPLSIDAGIVVATTAIYHLRPSSAADLRAAEREAAEREAAEREQERQRRETARMERERLAREEAQKAQVNHSDRVNDRAMNDRPTVHVPEPPRAVPDPAPVSARPMTEGAPDDHLIEARELLARTGKRTPAETVAEVLRLLDDDTPVLTISANLGMGERTVRQIRDARRELVTAA